MENSTNAGDGETKNVTQITPQEERMARTMAKIVSESMINYFNTTGYNPRVHLGEGFTTDSSTNYAETRDFKAHSDTDIRNMTAKEEKVEDPILTRFLMSVIKQLDSQYPSLCNTDGRLNRSGVVHENMDIEFGKDVSDDSVYSYIELFDIIAQRLDRNFSYINSIQQKVNEFI